MKLIKKIIKSEEQFSNELMEAYKTPEATIIVETEKEIPYVTNAIVTGTPWKKVAILTSFTDAKGRYHVFPIPEIPEVIYWFIFE